MGHSDMALAASVLASSRALFVFGVDKTPVAIGEVGDRRRWPSIRVDSLEIACSKVFDLH